MTIKRLTTEELLSLYEELVEGEDNPAMPMYAPVKIYIEAVRARKAETRLEAENAELRKQVIRIEIERDIWVDRHRRLEKRLP